MSTTIRRRAQDPNLQVAQVEHGKRPDGAGERAAAIPTSDRPGGRQRRPPRVRRDCATPPYATRTDAVTPAPRTMTARHGLIRNANTPGCR